MLIRKEDRKTANVFIFRVCFCLGSVVLGWALITPAGGTLPLSGAQFKETKEMRIMPSFMLERNIFL